MSRPARSFAPRVPTVRALLCLGLAAGCRAEQPDNEPAGAAPAAPADLGPDAAPPLAPAAPRQDTAVVRSLTDGDRGCYVVLEDEQGARFDRIAPFELCERQELVGRRVRVTLGPGEVSADSCQGSPECTARDTVEVLKAAEALP
jgi:hypothetical protein